MITVDIFLFIIENRVLFISSEKQHIVYYLRNHLWSFLAPPFKWKIQKTPFKGILQPKLSFHVIGDALKAKNCNSIIISLKGKIELLTIRCKLAVRNQMETSKLILFRYDTSLFVLKKFIDRWKGHLPYGASRTNIQSTPLELQIVSLRGYSLVEFLGPGFLKHSLKAYVARGPDLVC